MINHFSSLFRRNFFEDLSYTFKKTFICEDYYEENRIDCYRIAAYWMCHVPGELEQHVSSGSNGIFG